MKSNFKDLTLNWEPVQPYLGQIFATMAEYVGDQRELHSPRLSTVHEDAERLGKVAAETFHSTVIKLEYLVKRVGPDLLTVAVFLN